MSAEVGVYQSLGSIKGTKIEGKSSIFNFKNLLYVSSFILSRISLIGGFTPFGISFLSGTINSSSNKIILFFITILSVFFCGLGENTILSLFSITIYYLVANIVKDSKRNAFLNAGMAGASVFLVKCIFLIFNSSSSLNMYKVFFETVIVFSISIILNKSINAIENVQSDHKLTTEELLGISVMFVLCIIGLPNISVLGINLIDIILNYIILCTTFLFGFEIATPIGLVVAGVYGIQNNNGYASLITYPAIGVLGGILNKIGKMGIVLAFICVKIMLVMNNYIENDFILISIESFIGLICFIATPKKYFNKVSNKLSIIKDNIDVNTNQSVRIRQLTSEKLYKYSKAFKKISGVFDKMIENKNFTEKYDISALFDMVADKVCKKCSLCSYCWEKNFYNTYQSLFFIMEIIDEKGRIYPENIPDYFKERCERLNPFINAVNNVYEVFKVNMVWKNKISESRGMFSQQMEGISDIIARLSNEVSNEIKFNHIYENILSKELKKIYKENIEVIVFENNKIETYIYLPKDKKIKNINLRHLENLISKVVEKKMIADENTICVINEDDDKLIKFIESENYEIITGISKIQKFENIVSGDNCSFFRNDESKYIMILCDGVGTGQLALNQSKTAIELLESLLEMGFDKDVAIKTINSVLLLKSNNDYFSTIDLAQIDLCSGIVEFIKIGAAPTFIKRNSGVETIKAVTLPAGLLNTIEVEMTSKKLNENEFLIMMSDGIYDVFKERYDENKLIEIITDIESKNPQEISDILLSFAIKEIGGKASDDMTVMVAKAWKK